MKIRGQVLAIGAVMVLAACGGGSSAPQQAASTPQLLAYSTSVNGVTTFSGNRANYTITKTATGYAVKDNVGADGTVNLTAPMRLVFADVGIAFDLTGMAGKAYRVYQAAFNRTPDAGGLGFWIYNMDQGATLSSVSAGFMASEEFKSKYGANPSNAAFVTSLYTNVLHRALDQGGYDYWVGNLNNNAISMPDVLAFFSESEENKAQVAAAIANGITYTPYAPPEVLAPLTNTKLSSCPDSGVIQAPQFYQCMVGTISGQTTFGSNPCTLTIASNGSITLAANGSSEVFTVPYQSAVYYKTTLKGNKASYRVSASAGGFVNNVLTSIKIENVSPQYSVDMLGTTPSGMQASTNAVSCKFTPAS